MYILHIDKSMQKVNCVIVRCNNEKVKIDGLLTDCQKMSFPRGSDISRDFSRGLQKKDERVSTPTRPPARRRPGGNEPGLYVNHLVNTEKEGSYAETKEKLPHECGSA